MDPTLITLTVVSLLVIIGAACGVVYSFNTRRIERLGEVDNQLAWRVYELEQIVEKQQAWVEDALTALRDDRIKDMAAVAENLHEMSRRTLSAPPRVDLTGKVETSGAVLFDAVSSDTGVMPIYRTDLTMSTYTRTEAAQLDELLHAGASR